MFEDGPRAAVIMRVGEAIFGDIEWLVATGTLIDGFQDAIKTFRIDFAEEIFFAWVIADGVKACEATTKEFRRDGRIEANHVTSIIIDAVKIAGTGGMCDWSKERV